MPQCPAEPLEKGWGHTLPEFTGSIWTTDTDFTWLLGSLQSYWEHILGSHPAGCQAASGMQLFGFHMGTTPAFDQSGRGLIHMYDREREGERERKRNLELELSSSRDRRTHWLEICFIKLRLCFCFFLKNPPQKTPTTVHRRRASSDSMALFLQLVAAYFPILNGEGLSMLGFALFWVSR